MPSTELAAEMTAAYEADTDALGLGRPDHEPRAAETIGPIVDLIGDLIDSGHAYAAGGDVYFDVASFPGYGKLSNRPAEEMQQGEGDDAAELKRSPRDFALWKARKEGEDTAWPAPWGEGRPGWHIECSAMAEQLLGTDFEIHGGGSDLVFPHHENEIAQTEAARGAPLARIWMHNGMVRMGDEKMAKSVGNIRLLHQAIEEYGSLALIMYFGQGHYRQPIAFSPEALEDAGRAVDRLRELGRRLDPDGPEPAELDGLRRALLRSAGGRLRHPGRASRALRLGARGQPPPRRRRGDGPRAAARRCCTRWGSRRCWRRREAAAPTPRPRTCSTAREAARAARDFELADRLRDELAERGYEVRDTAEGARLVRQRVIVYGRNPVREALRGRAPDAQGVGHAEQPLRSEPWLRGGERERGGRRGAGGAVRVAPSTRASAPRSIPTPTPTPESLLDAEDALVVCLDEVQDPHNLGAVCRVAEAAGASGRRDPAAPVGRGEPRPPARRRPGRSSTCAVARVRNLADWLADGQAARSLGLRRAGRARARCPTTSPTTRAGSCWCWDRRAAGCARAWPRPAISSWRCRSAAAWSRSTCPPRRRRCVYGILHLRAAGLDRGP